LEEERAAVVKEAEARVEARAEVEMVVVARAEGMVAVKVVAEMEEGGMEGGQPAHQRRSLQAPGPPVRPCRLRGPGVACCTHRLLRVRAACVF
jgi:hypothetical protein